MRLLVCGDRDWKDERLVLLEIEHRRPEVVIEGEYRGADRAARAAADYFGIPVLPFPADWKTHGRAAGVFRNTQMLTEGKPDLVLAFHDDLENSKGTKDMIEQATAAGIPVEIVCHEAKDE
jgi:hypothetical protein